MARLKPFPRPRAGPVSNVREEDSGRKLVGISRISPCPFHPHTPGSEFRVPPRRVYACVHTHSGGWTRLQLQAFSHFRLTPYPWDLQSEVSAAHRYRDAALASFTSRTQSRVVREEGASTSEDSAVGKPIGHFLNW